MLSIASPAACAFAPALAPARVNVRSSVQMNDNIPVSLAPEGMGAEYLAQPRKPLSEYVGAFGEPNFERKPWDPMGFSELWRVSSNNPDVAWLREAELKHGRLSMLAFIGTLVTNGGVHLPGPLFTDSDWTTAWGSVPPQCTGQILAAIALIEGTTSAGVFDMYFGVTKIREPGDLGFDPLRLMPKDPKAADKMRLKELKNGRMAMIAMAGFACNHFLPGSVPGLQGFLP